MFKARAAVFDEDALNDLRSCADLVIERANATKTSLGHHLRDAVAREHIGRVARRFYTSSLPSLFTERFGTPPALNLSITTVRLQKPDAQTDRVNWHLDFNFVLDTAPFLVAWTPLEDVGTTRLGLDVCLPGPSATLRPLLDAWARKSTDGLVLQFGDEELDDLFGKDNHQSRTLNLTAGDSAVFDQFVLHRTQNIATATALRRSFEFRMVDLSALPAWWHRTPGLYCRPNDGRPDEIDFLIKSANESIRPIAGAEFDTLDGVVTQ
ncbi:hypothetical protein [Thalassobaculum sp.]|uniref:hypothetical protein n=1 Tax=Thalassobaculum sp. TaxID=2022740 RepID=UPI0032ECF0A3